MQSRKLAGSIGRFLRNYKILQILGKHFILSKKTKASSQKILPFRAWSGVIFLDFFWADFADNLSIRGGFRFSMESCLLSDLKCLFGGFEGEIAQRSGISWKSVEVFLVGEMLVLDRFDNGSFRVGSVDWSRGGFWGDFEMNVSRSSGILLVPISESMGCGFGWFRL